MPDAALTITELPAPGTDIAVLQFDGPIVISHLFQFQTELRNHTAKLIILKLDGVPYMDSSGLGAILNAYVSAQKNGRRLVLAGVNDRVKALLQLTKVDSVLKLCPDVEAAAQS